MSYQIVVRPEAELDFNEAFNWYGEQRQGLEDAFLLSADATIASIQRNPELYPIVHRNVRRSLIKRFPFGIFYIIDQMNIVIIAIFHAKRNPKNWQNRI